MDYKETLSLPRTEFPMRADLARREPQWLARWQSDGQYERVLAARQAADAPRFVLHDGPPYPTGGIHYGTLLNKVLKDIVVRSRLLMGFSVRFVPGWDCHGLPIEHQIEQELAKAKTSDGGKSKAELSPIEFRALCEAHAHKFVGVMRTEFRRLGCLGTWDDPYLTLSKDYEAAIATQLAGFAKNDLLYRAKRPVQWCLSCRTALAEAEVEYAEHTSPSIFVRFPLLPDQSAVTALFGVTPAALVIWTTTPWTLPANLAVVANPELDYVGLPVTLRDGTREILIVARALAGRFLEACGLQCAETDYLPIARPALEALKGVRYRHPFVAEARTANDFRLYFAAHATTEVGTGLVHTAPGHGADDYSVGRVEGLDVYAPVDESGRYTAEVPVWTGLSVWQANPKVVSALFETGFLLNKPGDNIKHSYPHCWRCKSPLIFRATAQWFARLGERGNGASLRERALAEIDRTEWIPAWGRDRIRGMIEVRPDWCLSRQRVWGVPIPALRDPETGDVATSAALMEKAAAIFAAEGSNAWFEKPVAALAPADFTLNGKDVSQLEKARDIVDVWFESGVSWAAVADGKLVEPGGQVDLYLEGADQHRGWFHSSLLASVATRGKAPYKAVLTHGWVLDQRGKVYSKSEIAKARAKGEKIDYVDPGEWMQKNGAELLRFWVGSSDYQTDVVFSATIMQQLSESYRKVRNTCRFLLSNLEGFSPKRDALPDDELRELDLLALGILRERDHQIFAAYQRYAFHEAMRLCVDYCITLSAEYLDPVKDVLYCEAPASRARRSVQTVLHEMIRTLATAVAPVLCFTAQDVADELTRMTNEPFDVHGQIHREPILTGKAPPDPNRRFREQIRPRREAILAPLETFRAAGHKSLDAKVLVRPSAAERPHWVWNLDHLTELTVVSQIDLHPEDAVGETEITVEAAPLPACPRCWRRLPDAGDVNHPGLCQRCAAVMKSWQPPGGILSPNQPEKSAS